MLMSREELSIVSTCTGWSFPDKVGVLREYKCRINMRNKCGKRSVKTDSDTMDRIINKAEVYVNRRQQVSSQI